MTANGTIPSQFIEKPGMWLLFTSIYSVTYARLIVSDISYREVIYPTRLVDKTNVLMCLMCVKFMDKINNMFANE